jgi:hypothetical protein
MTAQLSTIDILVGLITHAQLHVRVSVTRSLDYQVKIVFLMLPGGTVNRP